MGSGLPGARGFTKREGRSTIRSAQSLPKAAESPASRVAALGWWSRLNDFFGYGTEKGSTKEAAAPGRHPSSANFMMP